MATKPRGGGPGGPGSVKALVAGPLRKELKFFIAASPTQPRKKTFNETLLKLRVRISFKTKHCKQQLW